MRTTKRAKTATKQYSQLSAQDSTFGLVKYEERVLVWTALTAGAILGSTNSAEFVGLGQAFTHCFKHKKSKRRYSIYLRASIR